MHLLRRSGLVCRSAPRRPSSGTCVIVRSQPPNTAVTADSPIAEPAPKPQASPAVQAATGASSPDPREAQRAELLERFKLADVDGNGTIDKAELRTLLQSTAGGRASTIWNTHWVTDEELDTIMETYDKDKNGTIDFEEFSAIINDGLLLEGTLAEYEEAFRAADASGNGSIGANELARMLVQMGQGVRIEDLVEIFQKYDKDESGQIEFGEFLSMFRNKLLDLKLMKDYQALRPSSTGPAGTLLLDDGDIALIFSEKELQEVLEQGAQAGKLVVLFASLTWCRPCKAMQRSVVKLAEAYKDSATFVKLVGNANAQTKGIFSRLKVRSTPCFVMYNQGEAVLTMTGANKERLEDNLRKVANPAKLPELVYPPAAEAAPPS